MTLTHLIPLSQFVDKIDEIVLRDLDQSFDDWKLKQLGSIKRYTAFLLRPLELFMFVPVSDSGEVLEEPKPEDYFPIDKPINEFTEEDGKGLSRYYSPMMAYEEAKEKCLFEGFKLSKCGNCIESELIDLYPEFFEGQNVEMIAELALLNEHEIPLTAQAIKQILG